MPLGLEIRCSHLPGCLQASKFLSPQDLDVPDHVHKTEKKRNGVTRTTIAFGFPLAADGQAAVLPGMHAFAFLPIFPSGLSFMVQVSQIRLSLCTAARSMLESEC